MRDFLYGKTHLIASVNIGAGLLSFMISNPLGFLAAVLAVIAGGLNVAILTYKWIHRRDKD